MHRRIASVALMAALAGCGSADAGADMPPAGDGCASDGPVSRTISCVLAFDPGPTGGNNGDSLPAVVSGVPIGGGLRAGSVDVVSLGEQGEIVVGFGGGVIVDGPGLDLLVFENPFHPGGVTSVPPFAELGEVSVSDDGETWTTFPCAHDRAPPTGCAGWHPVLANPDNDVSPFDPDLAGGDGFDLADVGLSSARYLRVRDLETKPPALDGLTGFDLDAVAILNLGP